jgi:hypothetical protein
LVADADLDRAWRSHLDYDRHPLVDRDLWEAYVEWGSGAQRLRLGRFQVPFGIHSRSELYYVGLVYAPILKYYLGYDYQVGRSEHGVAYLQGLGPWQVEAALFAERGGLRTVVPSGGEGSLRVQRLTGPVILGLNLLRGHADQRGGPDREETYFYGVDLRYSQPSLILRGELVYGDVPGGTTRGCYLDALYRPASLHRLTLVGRVESVRGRGVPEPVFRRQTLGIKWDLGYGSAIAVNQLFETPRPGLGRQGTTVWLWHTRRL